MGECTSPLSFGGKLWLLTLEQSPCKAETPRHATYALIKSLWPSFFHRQLLEGRIIRYGLIPWLTDRLTGLLVPLTHRYGTFVLYVPLSSRSQITSAPHPSRYGMVVRGHSLVLPCHQTLTSYIPTHNDVVGRSPSRSPFGLFRRKKPRQSPSPPISQRT